MRIDLSGRVALVTGSTRGIGHAIATALAAAGASVAITGRDRGRADEVAAALGGAAKGFACDVTDVAAVTALIEAVESAFGSLDILVNNAGLTRDNILPRMKDAEWDTVIDANLRSAFATTRAASRGDDETTVGAGDQYFQHRGTGRQQGAVELRGQQGGADRIYEVGGQGAGLA